MHGISSMCEMYSCLCCMNAWYVIRVCDVFMSALYECMVCHPCVCFIRQRCMNAWYVIRVCDVFMSALYECMVCYPCMLQFNFKLLLL
jgi:hypothetical protein